jgi:hypothetical protein
MTLIGKTRNPDTFGTILRIEKRGLDRERLS